MRDFTGYRLTGHALVDAGIAGMLAFSGKSSPDALTHEDLEQIAGWLADLYTTPGTMQRMIRSMAFFNAGYYVSNPVLRESFIQRVLYAWKAVEHLDTTCIFCESPAVYLANREELPLVNGRGVINFNGMGRDGTPICGFCSLAVQMVPIVSVKSERFLMVILSDDEAVTRAFARENYRKTRQFLTLETDAELQSLPFIKTRFVETCVKWFARSQRTRINTSITAYCFTNYGSKAEIYILRLDASVFNWLDAVLHGYDASLRIAWERAVESAWGNARTGNDDDRSLSRNQLYEKLTALPHRPLHVLQYLIRTGHWGLVESFLLGIMDMTPEYIALLKQVGERLAGYAKEHRSFFFEFSREDQYAAWRRKLLRAADDCKRRYGQNLITFEEFLQIFTTPDKQYHEWKLPRDLIVLMMIDKLDSTTEDALFETEAPTMEEE